MSAYRRRLEKDLDDWIERGLVDPANRDAILASAPEARARRPLAAIVAILGVIFLSFGAMAFVAANWPLIPTGIKVAILFTALIGAYAAAAVLFVRGLAAFAQAAVLLGVTLFGVNIMLIGQIYNLTTDTSGFFLLWALGALTTAAIVPSRPALGAAVLIGTAWTVSALANTFTEVHWAFLPFWTALFLLTHLLGWRAGFHLVLLSALVWMVSNTAYLADTLGWGPSHAAGLLTMKWLTVWAAGRALEGYAYPYARIMQVYGLIVSLGAFFFLQTIDNDLETNWGWFATMGVSGLLAGGLLIAGRIGRTLSPLDIGAGLLLIASVMLYSTLRLTLPDLTLWLYGALIVTLAVWLVVRGAARDDRLLVNLGFVYFGAEAIYIYTATFGTRLTDAAFFLVGGVLLLVLAYGMHRLRARVGRDYLGTRPDDPDGPASGRTRSGGAA